MPTTRSESLRSRITAETSASDYSVGVPVTANASTSSQSTLRSPPPCVNVRTVGSPARQVGEVISRNTDPAPIKGSIPVFTTGMDDVTPNVEHSELLRMKDNIKESHRQALDVRRTSLKPCKPTRADTAHTLPRKKKSEIEIELAQREYEAAKASEKLARAKLLALQEQEVNEDEMNYEQEHHVEEWIFQTSEEKDDSLHQQSRQNEISTMKVLIQEIKKLNSKDKDIIELPSFSGASAEWLNFKKAYFESADNFSHAMNRARLRKALRGTAKEAVESLMYIVDDPKIVMQHLEDRFGRPGSLALSELEKMKLIKPVKNDPRDICRFASQVKSSISVIKALKKPQYLYSPETSNCIREKMTMNMHDRYVTFYSRYRDTEVADLEVIDLFLTQEIQNYGVFAPPEIYDTTKPRETNTREAVNAMLEPEEEEKESPSTSCAQETAIRVFRKSCTLCEGNHGLLECRKFKESSIDERWEIAKKARICFKCLRYKHQRLDCRAPPCRKCRRYHHVALHSDRPETKTEQKKESCNNINDVSDPYCDEDEYKYEKKPEGKTVSIHTTRTDGKVYLKMAPVNLYGPKGQTRVLALLDEGSTISLLDSSIAEKIGVDGKRESLTIETIGGKEIKNNSFRVKLKIKGIHGREMFTMQARTMDDLKLSEQEVAAKVIRNCPHLERIKKEVVYIGEKPKLLIGQDNWELIYTRKLLKGKESKPVASLTRLGWVLHGFDTEANAVVNFISHCRIKEDEKEVIVKEHSKLQSLETRPNLPSTDCDRRLLEILEKPSKTVPAEQTEANIEEIRDNAGLYLQGWTKNNDPEVIEEFTQKIKSIKFMKEEIFESRNTREELENTKINPTKREETSDVISTFDSLRFASPVLIQGKKLIHNIFRMILLLLLIFWDQIKLWLKYMKEKEIRKFRTVPVSMIVSPDTERFLIWSKMIEFIARIIRFLDFLRKRRKTIIKCKDEAWTPGRKRQRKKERIVIAPRRRGKIYFIHLVDEYSRQAGIFLISRSETENCSKEKTCLQKDTHSVNSSRLKKTDAYLSNNEIVKLRSRKRNLKIIGKGTNETQRGDIVLFVDTRGMDQTEEHEL